MPDGVAAARALGLDLGSTGAHRFRDIRFREGEAGVEAAFPRAFGLGLRRSALHQLMVDRAAAAGIRMLWGARVTGIGHDCVYAGDRTIRTRWIVGADGGQSTVRRWVGLDACVHESRRYGFRRHYQVDRAGDFMELHWGDRCQLYLTPVAERELCVVLIGRDPRLRLDDALPQFPEVARRLALATSLAAGPERGGVSTSRRLKSVCLGNVALVGDASGSVDAITGEGLCLLFQHATALVDAFTAGDLAHYQAAHRRIGRRPEMMANLMLLLAGRGGLRRRAIRALAAHPPLFARMLALHIGDISHKELVTNSLSLGWHMLTI